MKGPQFTFTGPPPQFRKRAGLAPPDVYSGYTNGKMPKHPRKRALCEPCAADNHVGQHTKVGCIRTIGRAPFDFICLCAREAA